MMTSFSSVEPRLPHELKRVDQPLDVLVRLDVADVQHEVAVELIPLAHAPHVVFGRLGGEPLVDRVGDDGDLLGRHAEVVAGCRASTPPRP